MVENLAQQFPFKNVFSSYSYLEGKQDSWQTSNWVNSAALGVSCVWPDLKLFELHISAGQNYFIHSKLDGKF